MKQTWKTVFGLQMYIDTSNFPFFVCVFTYHDLLGGQCVSSSWPLVKFWFLTNYALYMSCFVIPGLWGSYLYFLTHWGRDSVRPVLSGHWFSCTESLHLLRTWYDKCLDTVSTFIHLPWTFPPTDILFKTTDWIIQNGPPLYQIYKLHIG